MTDSPLLSPMAENYWNESRQPLMSLVFIMPMMLIYELGVWKLGVQNGADVWMGKVLAAMDFRLHLFLPLMTVGILLGWHYLTHHPWRFSWGVLSTMAVESLLLAVCLRVLLVMQGKLVHQIAAGDSTMTDKFKEAVGYFGAGIYEELLFRLILLFAAAWIIRLWLPDKKWSMMLAVLATSALFSAAHHVGAAGYPFKWFDFSFRFLAGIFFSVLLIYRGFGITAGAHAFYDILAAIFY
jgi:hypothetical protein